MSLSSKLLTAGAFLSFFVFGFVDNLKGPLLPEILRSEGMSYAQGGTFFLAAYIGFIIATLASGVLADMLSNRYVMLLSAVCLIVGASGLNVVSSLLLLNVSMAIIGLGLGGIEVGANGLMIELHTAARARYLNLLGTFHGVGSLTVPLLVAWLIAIPLRWPQIYFCTAILGIPLLVLFALTRRDPPTQPALDQPALDQPALDQPALDTASAPSLDPTLALATPHQPLASQPTSTPPPHALTQPAANWLAKLRFGFTWRMGWFYILICSYVAAELGLAAWLVEYLQVEQGMSTTLSSLYLSSFFVLIMLGRFFGSWWIERVGYLRMIALALAGTFACLVAGIFGPDQWTWLLPFSGLFMSIVFPTIAAAVAAAHPTSVGSVLGLLFTFGGVGGALGPWVIGLVSQAYGLSWGLATTLIFCAIAIAALTILARPRIAD